ncbi:MAG: hypothetical protein HYV63_01735 [Candidatus Schekmanbacteria bacterium]|nr:hypothetical protein [Candidatus Schekmanbacteria bacterium]
MPNERPSPRVFETTANDRDLSAFAASAAGSGGGGETSALPGSRARTSWLERVRARLQHRRAPLVIILAAVTLAAPCLAAKRLADDYIHQLRLSPDNPSPGFPYAPLDLFVFASGEPAQRAAMMESGGFAWWTSDGFQLSFWRPLSACTHVLDHWLFPTSSVWMHAHSLLWFGALLLVVHLLYRRIHEPWIAGLALLLYAVDDARGMVLSFVANRNALIAATLAVAALVAHDAWRRSGWQKGCWLGPLLFGLALLAGESALAITAYLFSYALFLDSGALRFRLLRLTPFAVITVAWSGLYAALGYGTRGGGIYVHPLQEPIRFVGALLERLPVLLLAQLGGPWSDLWLLYPAQLRVAVYGLALAAIGSVLWLAWPVLRAQAAARFWALGALLAAVPVCATFTSDRLLVFTGIGGMGLIATFLAATTAPGLTSGACRRAAVRVAVPCLIAAHLALAPTLLPFRAVSVNALADAFGRIDAAVFAGEDIRDRTLVVVNAPADGFVAYLQSQRQAAGKPTFRKLRLLATGLAPVEVQRLDERTLRVRPRDGFYSTEGERMVRGLGFPFHPQETITLSDLVITVREVTSDGRAAVADFQFAAPLDDPSLLLMAWADRALGTYVPPAVGSADTLPPIDLLHVFAGN